MEIVEFLAKLPLDPLVIVLIASWWWFYRHANEVRKEDRQMIERVVASLTLTTHALENANNSSSNHTAALTQLEAFLRARLD